MVKNEIVDQDAVRPAGRPGECFYCHATVGTSHAFKCPIPTRRVRIRMTVEYEIDVPRSWGKEQVEFHRNDSSWCADNALGELQELVKGAMPISPNAKIGPCLCRRTSFEYLGDADGDYA